MSVTIDPDRTVDLLQELVAIASVNPSLVPGGPGEGAIAAFVAEVLTQAGIETEMQEVAPGRPNVLGRLRGQGGGRTLILNAHLDTVSLAGMEDPLSGRIEGGRLYGRGALDTKGALAAALSALLALHAGGDLPAGGLILAGTVDEEYGSAGSEALVRQVRGDGCIVLEPTGLAVQVAHGGFAWAEIETEGVAAHGSAPDEGVDAIAKMGAVLTALDRLSRRLQCERVYHSPLGGKPMAASVHASIITGGRELSTYPDRCRLQLERRFTPGEVSADIDNELQALIARPPADAAFRARWRRTLTRSPWEAQEGPLLATLERACTAEVGRSPARATAMSWTDAAIMQQAGIPSLVFGPAGSGAHATVEYVETASVVACARILARLALDFWGT